MKNNSTVKFLGFWVSRIEYDRLSSNREGTFDIKLNSWSEDLKENPNQFSFYLAVTINSKDSDPPEVNLEILFSSIFEIDGKNISEKDKNFFQNAGAMTVVFPYVRSFVSTYFSLVDLAPLRLPLLNFLDYQEDQNADENEDTKTKT